jgi:pSer/pThr/pTyr-binding forkhead associated (FHA) protein
MSRDALLVLQEGPNVHRLRAPAVVLGRSHACDLEFDKKGVSRRHCEIVVRRDGVIVRDLGSTHGTLVDGSRISGEALVQRGAVLRLGSRGPRIRIVDARIGGIPVPHAADDEPPTREAAAPAEGKPSGVPRTVLTDGVGASSSPSPATAPVESAPTASGFVRGVVLGTIGGLATGVALLFALGGGGLVHAVRDALGLL